MKQALIKNQRPVRRALRETIRAAQVVKKVLDANDLKTEEGRLVAASQLLYRLDRIGFIDLNAVTK